MSVGALEGAIGLGKDVISIVRHPIETVKAVGSGVFSVIKYGAEARAGRKDVAGDLRNLGIKIKGGVGNYITSNKSQIGAKSADGFWGPLKASFHGGKIVGNAGFNVGATVATGGAAVTAKTGAKITARAVNRVIATHGDDVVNFSRRYADDISGSVPLSKNGVLSIKGRLKAAQLPTHGKMRFVPTKGYNPANPLERGPSNGFFDRFGNEWVKGPSRTIGQSFEWDVQLSRRGQAQLGWLSRDKARINVSLDGRVTHK